MFEKEAEEYIKKNNLEWELECHSMNKKMTMEELSAEMRANKARCSTYCSVWNSEDKDCEIYGNMHCPPSKRNFFLAQEVARRNEDRNHTFTGVSPAENGR